MPTESQMPDSAPGTEASSRNGRHADSRLISAREPQDVPTVTDAAVSADAGSDSPPAVSADGSVPETALPPAPASVSATQGVPSVTWLAWAETLQKVVLIGVPLVYMLGYTVWAYHAWRYSLGALPAVQSQYLTAGLVPAIILGLFLLSVSRIKAFVEDVGALFLPEVPAGRRRLRRPVLALYGSTCVVFAALLVLYLFGHPSVPAIFALYGSLYGVSLGLPVLVRRRDRTLSDRMRFDGSDWYYVAAVPALFTALFLCVYFRFVFPNVPQELGGALPRIARLDLDRGALSAERLGALLPPGAAHSKVKVVQTRPVYVFFAGAQSLLIKPYGRWADNQTYEVEVGTVKGITWLDRDGRPIQEPVHFRSPLKDAVTAPAKSRSAKGIPGSFTLR